MMKRIYILFLFSLSILFITPTQSNAGGIPADSLRTKWMNGKKFILHKVEPGETWSLLSRKYNNSIENLMEANKGIEFLKIGQIVNIPTESEANQNTATGTTQEPPAKKTVSANQAPVQDIKKTPVVHTVKQGETLFSIARQFDQPVEEIKKYNNLTSDNIRIDQKLIVKYVTGNGGNQMITKTEPQVVMVPSPAPSEKTAMASTDKKSIDESSVRKDSKDETPVISESTTETTKSESDMYFFDNPTKSITTLKKGNSGKSVIQVTETGVASWILDGQKDNGKFFGLHRSAPIGTIIKVTNRMNNQSVYVKVVGVLPDTGENEKVIIKLSQAVREKLNALDPFFQVELTYGMMR